MTNAPPDDGADRVDFSRALRARLSEHSARALAAKAHWGRTAVADITSGRKLPSDRQLDDLLRAAGASPAERDQWAAQLVAVTTLPRPPAPDDAVAEPGHPARSPRGRRRLAAAGVLAVGLIIAVIVVQSRVDDSASSAPTEPAPSGAAPTSPSAKGGTTAAIDDPADGASVGSRSGVRLSGTAVPGTAFTYWLLDKDPDGTYTVDLAIEPRRDGSWTALDAPVGEPTEVPALLTILLVRADHDCSVVLRRESDAEDSTFNALPKGCRVEDQVQVLIDRP